MLVGLTYVFHTVLELTVSLKMAIIFQCTSNGGRCKHHYTIFPEEQAVTNDSADFNLLFYQPRSRGEVF